MSSIENNSQTSSTEPKPSNTGATQQIKLRADIERTSYPDGSMQIRDPQSIRYFHLGFDEAEIVRMLDIMHPAQVLQRSSYSEDELKQLLGMLKQWGLLEGTIPPPRQMLRKMTALQFLFKRFEIIDPDDLLTKWCPKLRWLGSNPSKYFFYFIIMLTLLQAAKHLPEFMRYGWPLLADSWTITLIIFISMLVLVLGCHEICHGMVLKHFGGSCHEIGFYFIYATPALYADVSDIYKLPHISQKIWVILAGPIFQLVIGCISFLLWSLAIPHTGTANFFFLLVTASFFSLSINLNPLIRLDGYYALQLALDIHSLRRRAWAFVSALIFNKETEENLTDREKKVFLFYAPLSVINTCAIMVMTSSFYFQSTFLTAPAISVFVATILFLASQTDLPIKTNEETDKQSA